MLLIDGLNLVRRIYEANPAEDSLDKVEAAMRSSLGSFRRALTEHRPTHALAAFDYGGQTWRHDLYEKYREKRKPMPQILRDALPAFYEQLESQLSLKVLSISGVEADDVIGTAFDRWMSACPRRGKVVILTTDKDIHTLIAGGALVRNHFVRDATDPDAWFDESKIAAKFFVPSSLLADLLALIGDDTDDIPGVKLVGPKTASKWLLEHGSLDAVIANAASIKGKTGDNLRASLDNVRLARQLVALKTDVRLGVSWNDLRMPAAATAPA
ncbi:flap endonuclease [Paraburkholderia sp. UCT31]|nr:flap endonuclease [Paraburkholderia sp. UCT31]